jgi:hypothetical protein
MITLEYLRVLFGCLFLELATPANSAIGEKGLGQGGDQELNGHSDRAPEFLWRWENFPEGHQSLQHLNPIEHLWRDLKIAVPRLSPSNLTGLERICREEWEKFPKYRCAKLVASY